MQDYTIERGATSVILHVYVEDSATGDGKTGLTNASTGLVIAAVRPGEAAATVYTVAAGNVETIATIGTYAAPTSGKIRFKEIDATNLPGWYEVQASDALFDATGNRRSLVLSLTGASGMKQAGARVQLLGVSLQGTGVLVGDKTGFFLANSSIIAATFAAGAIDAAAIADGAIDAAAIADGAIADAKIASGAITSAKLAAGAISSSAFAAGAIDAAAFAAGAIDAAAFAQGAADKAWSSTTRQLTGTQNFNLTGSITGNLSGSVGSVTGNVGGNVVGSVGSIATGGIVAGSFASGAVSASAFAQAAADKVWASASRTLTAGVTLSSGALDAVWTYVLDGGYSVRQVLRGMASVLLGKPAGGATNTITFTGLDLTTVRVTMYHDAVGNAQSDPVFNFGT